MRTASPDTETVRPQAEPYIPPWTERWPRSRRLGFGIVAFVPTLLLLTTFLVALAAAGRVGYSLVDDVLPILFYTHVGSQFITLLVFGHLLIDNPRLSDRAKVVWGLGFLFLAPAVIPLFWWVHLMHPDTDRYSSETGAKTEAGGGHVHVYDFDYSAREHPPEGERERADGSIAHEIDARR
jgi:hypothetical protein